jgi:GH24 family phage-related lysozyme (muramidase)
MSYIEVFVALLGQPDRENNVSWLYRDSVGKMTVGIGTMLPNLAASQELNWYRPGEYPATPEDIAADWARVAAINVGYSAQHYHSIDGLYMLQADILFRAENDVRHFDNALAGNLPWYYLLPDSVKMAMLDIAYNVGEQGILKGFPKMLAALQAHNWPLAAVESKRPQLSIARNDWTANQIRMAR